MVKIDLHTHKLKEGSFIQVLNVFAQDLPFAGPETLISVGLHPWHIGQVNAEDCFQAIERSAMQKNMIAVGECGLDRAIATDFALQKQYFKQQIQLAERFSKPLIIHCVRAYSDLIRLKIESKSNIPWIIHGYCGNVQITRELVRHGFYFSVGQSLLKRESSHGSLTQIPMDHLFLETDESDLSIGIIYFFASQILKTEETLLEEAILNNFKTLFGNV